MTAFKPAGQAKPKFPKLPSLPDPRQGVFPTWLQLSDLQGLAQLGTQAALGVAGLAEVVQGSVYKTAARPWGKFGARFVDNTYGASGVKPLGLTGLAYGAVRGATRLAGGTVNAALARAKTSLDGRPASQGKPPKAFSLPREAMLSAINGVLGDHLLQTANPLAISMRLRSAGEPLLLTKPALAARFPAAGGKVLVLVHDLCMNDLQWTGASDNSLHDHGQFLARALGYTPVYLHYNSGLHSFENGAQLATLLQHLHEAWPQPVEEMAMLAHGLGGLVARSACHVGELLNQPWRASLKSLVFLGTPHSGMPAEPLAHWVGALLRASIVTRPLAGMGHPVSDGMADMCSGQVLRGDPPGDVLPGEAPAAMPAGLPLPAGVACLAIGGIASAEPSVGQDAAAQLLMGTPGLGDGVVPTHSALGDHASLADAAQASAFTPDHRFIAWQTQHTGLLYSARVADRLRQWLEAPRN